MANELKLNVSLEYAQDGISVISNPSRVQIDTVGGRATKLVQTIGTVEETLILGDVAAVRMLLIRNLDATNFIELGVATGVYGVRVRAGNFALYNPNGTTVFARANTASVKVEFTAIDA